MTDEDRQRQIVFIIEQQAQFAAQMLPVDFGRGGLMTNLKPVTRFFQRPYGRKSLLGY